MSSPLTYEPFFGLKSKPFSLASDPEFLYESPSHSAALLGLLAGIRRREGLLAFTGDVGTGKTTICRAVLRNLDHTTFSTFIPDPFASREDLLKMLLVDFGVTTVQDITTGPLARAGRTELSYLLSSFLDTLAPLDAFVVVFIDEAQNMSLSLLEEVRILSDTFSQRGKLQIVLVGQLELLDKLKSSTMRQVDQRVSVYTHLEPLSADDVVEYVQHRLQIAGGSANRPMFAPTALTLLYSASRGVPRVINRICDRALQIAYERRCPLIDRDMLEEALVHGPAAAPAPVVATRRATENAPVSSRPRAPESAPEAWLKELDGSIADSTPVVVVDAGTVLDLSSVVPSPTAATPSHDEPTPSVRAVRRWTKAGALAAAALVTLSAVIAAASYGPGPLTTRLQVEDLPPTPATPPITRASASLANSTALKADAATTGNPPAQYSVAVAAFATTARAGRIVQELRDNGFQAFIRETATRAGAMQQVLLGPYDSEPQARNELDRLKESGDYADARIMTSRSATN